MAEAARTSLAAAKMTMEHLGIEFEGVKATSLQRAKQAREASESLAKAKNEAAAIEVQLTAAKAEIAKCTAARVNVTLYAARKSLAERKAAYDQKQAELRIVFAELDAVLKDLAAAEEMIATGPARIKALENGVSQAKDRIELTKSAIRSATDKVVEKQRLVKLAGDFLEQLKVESTKASDDKLLAGAAGQAQAAFNLLNEDVTKAKQLLGVRNEEAEAAVSGLSIAEKAVVDARHELDAGPELVNKLRASKAEIATRTAPKRDKAKKALDELAVPVRKAQEEVDRLQIRYASLSHTPPK